MSRRIFALSALLLSVGATAGCGKEGPEGAGKEPAGANSANPGTGAAQGTKNAGSKFVTISREQQASWVRNFNPLLGEGSVRFPTVAGIYEPLIVYNTMKGEFMPWLATKYEWSDANKKLTFTTRTEVKWSDGQPFSAKDVAFTFGLLKKFPALDLTGVWKLVDSVEAKNDTTVEFIFKEPFVPGLSYIGHQPIVPEHKWKDVADPVTFTNENPVATGPFTEVKTFQNQIYELGKNPHYWQKGKPAVEGLRFPAYPGNDQANLALINGEVDWAGNFVPDIDKTYVSKDPENNHYWFPLVGGTVTLYPNATKKPFNDIKLRKAISMAIDRAQIAKIAVNGYTVGADATGLDDAYARWRNEKAAAADWTTYDVAKANALLDEAGYAKGADGIRAKDGKPLKFDINVVTGWSDWVRAVQITTQNLKAVGIEATLKTYDFSAFFEALQKGTFDMSMGWTNTEPTPFNFYRDLMGTEFVKPVGEATTRNWHRFGAKEAEPLFKQFASATDPADQKRIIDELQTIYSQQVPVIPLFKNPSWGEYSTKRFVGWPSKENPYAKLSPNNPPDYLIVLTEIKPK
ncbi:peptide ABC transporter substrate-binding protein [Sorangium cellulosum]|uniref:Peptide ABC transporter substrate-binding protein n=1 Tax=Sorangium cellulosum TaxID=56 RepID=A0A150SHG0_SORCE|nr:peptide ABC transporter substrate-binding protein [Sorangium cellulosum]